MLNWTQILLIVSLHTQVFAANAAALESSRGTSRGTFLGAGPISSWVSKTTSFYVSTDGNDSWSGLMAAPNTDNADGPFATITRAQKAMELTNTVKTVTLRGGTYVLRKDLLFSFIDGNETWTSYPGETAIIDGKGTYVLKLVGVNDGVSWSHLTFQDLGAGGIQSAGGGSYFNIYGNTFINCKQNCISGGALSHMTIDNNFFNGMTPAGQSAIQLWYGSSYNTIQHNYLLNIEGGGLNVGTGAKDPPANANVFDRNLLVNVNSGRGANDQGALYIVDASHTAVNNRITNNVVRRNGGGSITNDIKCIYLDDLASHVVVSGNVCGAALGQYAFQIHGGDHNEVFNNIFDLTAGALLAFYQVSSLGDYGMGANSVHDNIVYSSGAWPARLWRVLTRSGDALPVVRDNLYFSEVNGNAPNALVVDSHPIHVNPHFADANANNYSIKPSGVINGMGRFAALPGDTGLRSTNTMTTFSPGASGIASPCGSWVMPIGGYVQNVSVHTIGVNGGAPIEVSLTPNCIPAANTLTIAAGGPASGYVNSFDINPAAHVHLEAGKPFGFQVRSAMNLPIINAIAAEFISDDKTTDSIFSQAAETAPSASAITYLGLDGGNDIIEGSVAMPFPIAGTLQKLVVTNSVTSEHSATIRVRYNGSSSGSSISATIPAGASGSFLDSTHSLEVSQGGAVDLAATGGGGTPPHILSLALIFIPVDHASAILHGMINAAVSTRPRYFKPLSNQGGTTELLSEYTNPLNSSCNLSHLYVFQAAPNGNGVTTRFTLYKNGTATSISGTVGPSAVGAIAIDSTDTVATKQGDNWSLYAATNRGTSGKVGGWSARCN